MPSRTLTRCVWTTPLALATMFCLAGCSQTLWTPTGATDVRAAETVGVNVADLCARGWPKVTYSGRDTEQTQTEARANNAARAAYCGEKK